MNKVEKGVVEKKFDDKIVCEKYLKFDIEMCLFKISE